MKSKISLFLFCCLGIVLQAFAVEYKIQANGETVDNGEHLEGCSGLAVNYNVTPTTDIVSYNWSLGDGTTTPSPIAGTTYDDIGNYSVSVELTLKDGSKQTLTLTDYVEVKESPDVDLEISSPSICLGESIQLKHLEELGVYANINYSINGAVFSPNNGEYLDFTPSKTGIYEVVLEVRLPQGCTNFIKGSFEVKDEFTVDFTSEGKNVTVETTCADEKTLSFSAETSRVIADPTYEWLVNGQLISGSDNKDFTYTFSSTPQKEYTVEVGVYDGECYKVSNTKKVIQFIDFDNAFTASVIEEDCNTIKYKFTPKADLLNQEGSFRWDFGNGTRNASRLNSRTRTYTKTATAQKLMVSLTNRDDNSCVFETEIDIPEEIEGSFTLDETIFCSIPATTNVTEVLPNTLTDFEWNVTGGGSFSNYPNDRNPSFTFTNYGTYQIQLISADGCVLDEKEVIVSELDVNIRGPRQACIEDEADIATLRFTADVENGSGNYEYTWVKRDTYRSLTTNAGTSNPQKIDFNWGSYEVEVTVLDLEKGCSQTESIEVEVRVKPEVSFTLDKTEVCNNEPVEGFPTIENFSAAYETFLNAKGEQIIFEWDFDTNNDFNDNNPYTYENFQPSDIEVQLSSRYSSGINCMADIATQPLKILAPQAEFEMAIDLCSPTLLTITNISDEGDQTGNVRYDWEFIITDITGVTMNPSYTFSTTDITANPLTNLKYPGLADGRLPMGAVVQIILKASLITGSCEDIYQETITMPVTPSVLSVNNPSPLCLGETAHYMVEVHNPDNETITYNWTFTAPDGTILPVQSTTYHELYFTPDQLGEYTVELTYQYGSCPAQVFPVDPLEVQGIIFNVKADQRNFCEGAVPTDEYVQVTISEIYPTTAELNYEWSTNGTEIKKGTTSAGASFQIAYADLGLEVFDDQSQWNHVKLALNLMDGTTVSCPYTNDIWMHLTAPKPLPFDTDKEPYSIDYDYKCVSGNIDVDIHIGHDLNKGFNPNELVLEGYTITWEYKEKNGTGDFQPINPTNNYNQNKLSIFNLPTGVYTMKMTVEDANGCTDTQEFEIEMPEIIPAKADFEQNEILTCPGSLTLLDLDTRTRYSKPTMFVFNETDTLKSTIIKRFWNFGDGSTTTDLQPNEQTIEHFFDASAGSVYLVNLTITETFPNGTTNSCTTISEDQEVKIDGVEGGFDADRRIIHKEQTVVLTSIIDSRFGASVVSYIWSSGDGQLTDPPINDEVHSFTYYYEREDAYEPGLLYSSNGCISEAVSDVEILVLPCPTLPIEDVTFCVSDEKNTISAYDSDYDTYLNFTDDLGNTLVSEVHYQWFIEGVLVGEEKEITFEDGRDANPLTIDPDDEDGIELTLKVWVSSEYNGTVKTDVICSNEKTINVKYQHSPYPILTETENCTALALQANVFNFNYLDEEYTEEVTYAWTINSVNGGGLTSGTVLTDPLLALEATSFDPNAVKIDIDLSLTTSATQTLTCPQVVNTTYTIYRKPNITLQESIEGCENEILAVTPTAEEITDGYLWEWTELETTGGSLNIEELPYGLANFTEKSYDVNSFRIVSSWELKVSNQNAPTCYATDTIQVIFNQYPDLEFTLLQSCENWEGKFHAKNYAGTIHYVWKSPMGSEIGGSLASYEEKQIDNSTTLLLDVTSFEAKQTYIDEPLHFDTYLTSETGHECIVSKDTTIRIYRKPNITLQESIEGCENEILAVTPTAEEITDGYLWEWTELETTGGSLNIEELPYGLANFTEKSYDANSFRIVSSWELKVSNQNAPTCYATDTIQVIFNQYPDLEFTQLQSCETWEGKFHAKNYAGTIHYVWKNPMGSEIGGSLASYEEKQVDNSTILLLEVASFEAKQTYIDVPLHFDTYLTSETGHECIVSKDTTIRIYRKPNITLQESIEGCENEILSVTPTAEEITDGYLWEWTELETTGGSFNHTISGKDISFNTPIFDENTFHVHSQWELRVANATAENCYTLDTINVIFNRIPNAEFTFSRNPVCIGEVVELAIENSTVPTTGVRYHWDMDADGTYELTSLGDTSVVYPSAGLKSIKMYIETAYGCPSEVFEAILDVKPIPVADFSVENVCIGEPSTFINQSSIADGTALTYKWYFDEHAGVVSSEEENPIFTFANVGEHVVKLRIESPTGCIDSISYTTTIHPLPELKVSEDIYICYGQSVEIEAWDAQTYLWSTKQTTAKITVSPVADSTFYVSGFSEYGCETKDSVKVYIIPPITDTELFKEACEGDIILLDASTLEYEGIIAQKYEWSTGENTAQIEVTANGKYTVTTYVTHESGVECTFTQTYETVFHPNPAESFDDEIIHCFETGAIELTATAGENFIYYWEDTGETTRTVYRNAPNTFTVVMIDETHETRCETIEEFTVLDICPPRAVPPNAFTPNGDGLNDTFFVKLAYALNIEISIYNRWGEIVFDAKYPTVDEANDEKNGWDGTYRGRPSEPNVYYYMLRYESELERGTFLEKTGSLTLIR